MKRQDTSVEVKKPYVKPVLKKYLPLGTITASLAPS